MNSAIGTNKLQNEKEEMMKLSFEGELGQIGRKEELGKKWSL